MSIFDNPPMMPLKESFDHHTLIVKLLAGQNEQPVVEVECKGGDKDECACDPKFCQVQELIANVGAWDVIRAAGDIELARLSGRVDWSDPEEPWLDVEP